jgi:AraC-like DNA-binding protein
MQRSVEFFDPYVTGSQPVEENLALRPGVNVTSSVSHLIGGGARDPNILLNENALRMDGRPLKDYEANHTFDTFSGRNRADEADWYCIEFPTAVACNCVEMTMGYVYHDGGWWTSLDVETRQPADAGWRPVHNLEITPHYPFADTRGERRPYETYALCFDTVTAQAVRICGRPGGAARFTSLARLAVYHRDLSRWNPATLPAPPLPYLYRLLPPNTIWDLSENLVKLTGLAIGSDHMDCYLDEARYHRYWDRVLHDYQRAPALWLLIGDTIGWDAWQRTIAADPRPTTGQEPYIHIAFQRIFATAVAPIVIEDRVFGEISTQPLVLLKDELELAWHERFADELCIPWQTYRAAIDRTPQLSYEQLEGAAGLLGMIANRFANLVHRNLCLEHELVDKPQAIGRRSGQRKEIVRHAIDFMQEHLERPITVAAVAQAVALSPPYFSTLFTEETGQNPHEFLIRLRVERAKHYLAHTQLSVMEICTTLGYSASYFSRLFKQRMGCTPGAFSRRMRGR